MRYRVAAAIVVFGAAAAACSSSTQAHSLHLSLPEPTVTTTARGNAHAGAPHLPLAQFSVAEAGRQPAPNRRDAAALDALARGAAPTLDEVLAAQHAMDHMTGPAPRPATVPAELRGELAAATSAARRYPTAAAAVRAGYRLASRFIPGVGSHWIKWQLVTAPFDPGQPSMLLFDGNGPPARLAGLSYYTESHSPPTSFTAGGAQWHRHVGLCIVHGVLVGEGLSSGSSCPHGLLLPGRNIWMLHVWVTPGMTNHDGVFAPLNPALCTATAPCTAPLK